MRLLPEARNSRFLALVLLLIAVLAVYLLGVHWWFVSPHLAIAAQMEDLREQEGRFSAIVAQKRQSERRLAEARAFEQNNQAFLTDADSNSAFSDIVQRLKQVIGNRVGENSTCQIVSTSPFKNAEEAKRGNHVLAECEVLALVQKERIDDFRGVHQLVEERFHLGGEAQAADLDRKDRRIGSLYHRLHGKWHLGRSGGDGGFRRGR